MTIFESFIQSSCETFSLKSEDFANVTPHLISPFVVELPSTVLRQAQNIVADIYKLVSSPNYQKQVAADTINRVVERSPIPALLCSLDVHVNPDGDLKIIEINTNASAYLVTVMNYKAHAVDTFPSALEDLEDSFKASILKNSADDDLVVIMDHAPQTQRLYIEFLMYQKFLTHRLQRNCTILDPQEIECHDATLFYKNQRIGAIYNRHTDFFLETLPHIQAAHHAQTVQLSPHPWGYALLADKKRLHNIQNQSWCPSLHLDEYPHLQKALLKTFEFRDFPSPQDLWEQRHHYFFKPPESYGSKSVYSGKSISRKKFEEIFSPQLLAQESAPAPEVVFKNNGQEERFKYDLRFYFFEDRVQLGMARTYRGQLTNLQTPLGGQAPLVFT